MRYDDDYDILQRFILYTNELFLNMCSEKYFYRERKSLHICIILLFYSV